MSAIAKRSLLQYVIVSTGFFILITPVALLLTKMTGSQSAIYDLQMTVRYSFLVTNTTYKWVEGASFSVFALIKQNAYQIDGFLEADPLIKVDAPKFVLLSEKLGRNPKKIGRWLYQNVNNIGFITKDRGARYSVCEKQGDCTEFASACVALARTVDIPPRWSADLFFKVMEGFKQTIIITGQSLSKMSGGVSPTRRIMFLTLAMGFTSHSTILTKNLD
ncbi:transglutaminase domain-containing protein [Microbulbifer epialgicus]|uniref:Transglutaminase domain-containing protein n=1 Tax=Microbulbifer epialgicus TaxID=393907 RepID=A0ABV4NX51_9GAMM